MKQLLTAAWHCLRILMATVVVALASCAPKAIVVSPIAPKAVRVAETARATAKQADKVQKSVAKVSKESATLSAEILKGMMAADALRKAGLATQEQLDANAGQWQTVHARNLFLEVANQSATIDARELVEAAERGKVESEGLELEAVKTDKATSDLKSHMLKQEADASRGRAVKHGIWLLLGCGLLFVVVRFLLPLLIPR